MGDMLSELEQATLSLEILANELGGLEAEVIMCAVAKIEALARDAARYRFYRATTVRPVLFGDDGWSESDTDGVLDAAIAALPSTPTRAPGGG